ncbi:MAG: PAS domain S-box protein [Deltaproteobacteria bacterium]|nr:PAS domain S-box protein [Deltaproteobacteria bacterium]
MNDPIQGSLDVLPADRLKLLYTRHVQGAIVRSGASAIMWLFALAAYVADIIKTNHFTGITLSVLYLLLINPPTLFLLKRLHRALTYRYISLLINFLEILGYTAIIYFLGGIEATYAILVYAAIITYVGVVAPWSFPYAIACVCSIAFSLMVAGVHYGFLQDQKVIPSFHLPWPNQVVILSAITGLLFVVAYIASVTSNILKRNRNLLNRQNLNLMEKSSSLEAAERELRTAHRELERRVEERTLELKEANDQLKATIIQHKQAEEALRESEFRFRQLFESMTSGVAVYQPVDDGKDFVFVDFNRGAENIEGVDRLDVLGRRVTEAFPEVREFGLFDVFQRVWKTGETEYFPGAIYKDERDPGSWRENRVYKLPSGQIVAMYDDVTERKRAEEALRREKDRAQSYLDSASVMMLALDVNGQVTLVNKKGRETLGYEEADILGKNWFDTFVPERDRDGAHQVFLQIVSGGLEPATYFENAILASSGEERLIAWHNNFVTDTHGNIVGILGSGEDITDRRRAEQLAGQAERYRAVADLTAGIAHNFNNLLQIVIGNASLGLMNLRSGDLKDLKQNLEQIVESSRFGAETINRLNRYVRVSADDHTAAIEVFDLSDLITQAAEMSRPWWKTEPEKHGRRVSLYTRLKSGSTIRGKKNEMFEVVVNLIRNSVEALPKGGDIEIETTTENNVVILRVRDTGIGIREEDLNRLFTPFFTTNVESGRGLGLATCRRIVDSHGGTILVDSVEGKGARFTITLPLVWEGLVQSEFRESKSPEKALNVLAVDDMEAITNMLRDGLGSFGHKVFTALSGQEALAIFKDNPIDLVICDVGMPEMNGWEVGQTVKEICQERGTSKPAFIILTGWQDQSQEKVRMAKSGVDAVVQKPVEMAKLLEAIGEVTEHC